MNKKNITLCLAFLLAVSFFLILSQETVNASPWPNQDQVMQNAIKSMSKPMVVTTTTTTSYVPVTTTGYVPYATSLFPYTSTNYFTTVAPVVTAPVVVSKPATTFTWSGCNTCVPTIVRKPAIVTTKPLTGFTWTGCNTCAPKFTGCVTCRPTLTIGACKTCVKPIVNVNSLSFFDPFIKQGVVRFAKPIK